MNIELTRIETDFDGQFCYTHARAARKADGEWIMTTQPLILTGMDVFYGMELLRSSDGVHWSAPEKSKTLTRRPYGDDLTQVMCDATPYLHKKTGKLLLTGHDALYSANNKIAPAPTPRHTVYSVYDEERGDFSNFRTLFMPDEEIYYNSGAGCTQILEEPNGDLLIPFYFGSKQEAADPWHTCSHVAVMRCGFDGEVLTVKEIGNSLSVPVPRGLGEPSLLRVGDTYLLALRNDESGFVSSGTDGLHFREPTPLVFDNGENAGNYNTQQHWILGNGKPYLVYTRRGADNDHVFRHRAPLFIAEFDPVRMCIIRATEQIAVPERGARLGNFGCFSLDENHACVVASEWMQSLKGKDYRYCMEFGSDNSIFVSHITFDS